ncbi:MAG: indole-3-glycerol-phosphate synthase [Deltaproteobacteria bacterium]|nr:indole-3-glycerol-phosphate synthase [Deltaproteobacteria bacterium]
MPVFFMFLDTIAEHVRDVVGRRRRVTPVSALQERALFAQPRRGFRKSLEGGSRRIIAEVKRASPSQGILREEFDPVGIARDFFANGASALSVLTEERFFQGSLSYLERIREEVPIPLLRKDFVLDGYQLLEAKSFGADAVLLIVALLNPALLQELKDQAGSLSLDALVEVRLETTERLLPRIPAGALVVCESGIDNPQQMRRLEALGAHVFLVGEALMRAPDPGAKLRELLGNSE